MRAVKAFAFFLGLPVVFLLTSCSQLFSREPLGLGELLNAGFYAYLLPETVVSENEWAMDVRMSSVDRHCTDFFTEDTWNPVSISYRGDDNDFFLIRISPQDGIWDYSQQSENITIGANWIPDGEGSTYRTEQGHTVVKVRDVLGMDVVVTSTFDFDTTRDLMERLERNSLEADPSMNPWQAACTN